MLIESEVLKNIKQDVSNKRNICSGVVKSHPSKDFGFLELESGKSHFITSFNMRKVRHGDMVSGEVVSDNGRSNFVPLDLIESGEVVFLARIIKKEEKVCFVQPDSAMDNSWYFLSPMYAKSLSLGDYVKVELVSHPMHGKSRVNLVSFIAHSNDPKLPWKYAMSKNNIDSKPIYMGNQSPLDNFVFSPDVKRTDLTNLPFVTIDSESTRDMDDAVYSTALSDGSIRLIVAIADPSEAITDGTMFDSIAKNRAYTTYMPGMTIPMIPNFISEELFSLIEGRVRPVLCSQITINANGTISDYMFYEGIIKSREKLSYNNVNEFIENGPEYWCSKQSEVNEQLISLKRFYEIRTKYRLENELVFVGGGDYGFHLEDWKPKEIINEKRKTSNKMIEEAMILANQVMALYLNKNNISGIFTKNIGYNEKYKDEIFSILSKIGGEFGSINPFNIEGYKKIRAHFNSGKNEKEDLMLRKYLTRSEFSLGISPHFGLGVEGYATWTSPIRKYSDLLNHRLVKSHLRGIESPLIDNNYCEYLYESVSKQKRVEKTISDWMYRIYLDKGNVSNFEGKIMSLNKGGCIVKILDNGCGLFVSKMSMKKNGLDAFIDINNGVIKIGNGNKLSLGDIVNINIMDINMESKSIFTQLDI